MDDNVLYEFIGFGAMNDNVPYVIKGIGADGHVPYELRRKIAPSPMNS